MPLIHSSSEGNFTCFGETVSDTILNLYCKTSILAYDVNTLGMRSCAPISRSLVWI